MRVRCARCGRQFDDTYRRTFCPHDDFDMMTLVIKPGEPPRLVTRVEDLEVVPQ